MRDPLAHLPATKRKLVAPQADAHREFVVSQKTGEVRQAGADPHQQNWINEVRGRAERDLYFFTKVVLKRRYLTPLVHKPVCAFIQRRPPMRKLLEMFRESGKTSIVGHALPLHIHIQPKASNCYFPGEEGSEQRITLVGETEKRATDALRVIQTNAEGNQLMRALWPQRFWVNASKEAKRWSTTELIFPRANEWPDPSLRALGVGAAVTGSHPSVLIKDDLVTFDAANSETIMQTAIDWHIASRALINKPGCLEFIIGTRWAVHDLYAYIEEQDPSVDIFKMPLSDPETDEINYPEFVADGITYGFSETKREQLQKEFGVLYPLLYENTATDPSLLDFSETDLRLYHLEGDELIFEIDERDAELLNVNSPQIKTAIPMNHMRGMPLNGHTYELLRQRERYLRTRVA